MFKKSNVFFKGKASGLIVVINENASFEDIKGELLSKVKKSKNFFNGTCEDITIEGKELSDAQKDEIVNIILNNTDLEIGLPVYEPVSPGEEEGEEAKEVQAEVSIQEKFEAAKELFQPNESLLIFEGSVRSGKLVEADGNILIMGGVNPGGEVFAGRNIVVFGQLKGKAVAGRGGNKDCFIAAIQMEPELLGIDTYVTRFPGEKKSALKKSPSIARLAANKISIAPIGNMSFNK